MARPPCVFSAKFVAGGGRGGGPRCSPLCFFRVFAAWGAEHAPPNELCRALVSLVFLHTFFGLAQFCKKPCNPVFNVLQFFKKVEEHSIVSSAPLLYFSGLLQIQSEKGQKFNNPAAEQRSSPQGCTVRAKAAQERESKWIKFITICFAGFGDAGSHDVPSR